MAGTDFKVTPEDVSSAATNTENTANQITDELAVLRQYVVNLEASWQGIASNTFQNLMIVSRSGCSARSPAR